MRWKMRRAEKGIWSLIYSFLADSNHSKNSKKKKKWITWLSTKCLSKKLTIFFAIVTFDILITCINVSFHGRIQVNCEFTMFKYKMEVISEKKIHTFLINIRIHVDVNIDNIFKTVDNLECVWIVEGKLFYDWHWTFSTLSAYKWEWSGDGRDWNVYLSSTRLTFIRT